MPVTIPSPLVPTTKSIVSTTSSSSMLMADIPSIQLLTSLQTSAASSTTGMPILRFQVWMVQGGQLLRQQRSSGSTPRTNGGLTETSPLLMVSGWISQSFLTSLLQTKVSMQQRFPKFQVRRLESFLRQPLSSLQESASAGGWTRITRLFFVVVQVFSQVVFLSYGFQMLTTILALRLSQFSSKILMINSH